MGRRILLLALVGTLLGCASPPPPETPSSTGLALRVDARSPIRALPARLEHILFVRLEEGSEDPLRGSEVFYSNYKADGYFYLLNPPPGGYVAVGALTVPIEANQTIDPQPIWKDGKLRTVAETHTHDEAFSGAVYFAEAFVRQSQVQAPAGSLAFMGEFLVHLSPGGGFDPVQAHYFRLLQPGETTNWFVQAAFKSTGIYSGRAAAAQQDAAARERFSSKASEHLTSAGWGEMLR